MSEIIYAKALRQAVERPGDLVPVVTIHGEEVVKRAEKRMERLRELTGSWVYKDLGVFSFKEQLITPTECRIRVLFRSLSGPNGGLNTLHNFLGRPEVERIIEGAANSDTPVYDVPLSSAPGESEDPDDPRPCSPPAIKPGGGPGRSNPYIEPLIRLRKFPGDWRVIFTSDRTGEAGEQHVKSLANHLRLFHTKRPTGDYEIYGEPEFTTHGPWVVKARYRGDPDAPFTLQRKTKESS